MSNPSVVSRPSLIMVGVWLTLWGAVSFTILGDYARPDAAIGTYAYDFRDTVWLPIQDFLGGHLPWDLPTYSQRHPHAQLYPLYAPSYWWVLAPLLLLPYPIALALWTGVVTGSLVFLVWWSATRLCSLTGTRAVVLVLVVLAATVASRAGRSGLLTANFAIPCAAAAALVLTGRFTGWRQVALLMLAIVKPQVGIPLFALCLLRREFKNTALACAWTALLCLPIGIVAVIRAGGPSPAWTIIQRTLSTGYGADNAPGTPTSTQIDLSGAVQHVASLNPVQSLTLIFVAAAITGTGFLLGRRQFGDTAPETLLSGGLAVAIVLPNMIYSVAVLIPGLMVMTCRLLLARNWLPKTAQIAYSLTVLFVIAALANTGPIYPTFGIGPQMANFLTGLFLFAAGVMILTSTVLSRQSMLRETSLASPSVEASQADVSDR